MIKFVPGRGDFDKEDWLQIRNHERNSFNRLLKEEIIEWIYNFREEIELTKIRMKAKRWAKKNEKNKKM